MDVSAKCTICGSEVKVSEFADASLLKCSTCGGQMAMDKHSAPRKAPTVIKKKIENPSTETSDADPSTVKRPRFRKKRQSRLVRIAKFEISSYVLSWFLFLLLAPAMFYLRFGDIIQDPLLFDDVKAFGMVAIIILYIVVVLEAVKNELFDGMLCFFVWPYGLYYLFIKSDSFFLRALFAAAAVGFGYDFSMAAYDKGLEFYRWATYMINEGALK